MNNLKSFQTLFTLSVCACVFVHAPSSAHVEIKRTLWVSLLPFYHVGPEGQSLYKTWWQASLLAEVLPQLPSPATE